MSTQRIRLLSYNIHKGFKLGNWSYVLEDIRLAIRETRADIVFLQEVQGQHNEKGIGPQFEFLADGIWSHYAYGQNAVYTEGHHGNAILSQFPILENWNIDLSQNRFERRGLLGARVEIPKIGQLALMTTHMDLLESSRELQIRKIIGTAREKMGLELPLIFAGDFNDWRGMIRKELEENLRIKEAFYETQGDFAKSFPSLFPLLRLDRVYYRGLKVLSSQCLTGSKWRELSDHCPLLVEFEIVA